MANKDLLIVIPAFNEAKSLEILLPKLKKEVHLFPFTTQIIVINDGSSDDSVCVARGHGIQIIDLPINIGIAQVFHLAILIAISTKSKKLLILDGDGQHPISDIRELYNASKDCDVVIGSRNMKKYKMSFIRRSALIPLRSSLQIRHKILITDPTSGFRILDNSTYKTLLTTVDFKNYLEDTLLVLNLLLAKGFKVKEIEVTMNQREVGSSSTSGFSLIWNYLSILTKVALGKRGTS